MSDNIQCPACKGACHIRAFVEYANKSGEVGTVKCPTCKGDGWVTRQHYDRILAGEALRKARRERGLSLSEEAARLGISPVELSHRENGK